MSEVFSKAENKYRASGYVMPFLDYIQWCWDNERNGYLRYFK